jgi:hypothetical protein
VSRVTGQKEKHHADTTDHHPLRHRQQLSHQPHFQEWRKYPAFGVAIIADRNLQAFHYNVVAFGKQGHFAKPLQKGTRIKLVVQAQSQPDNIATLPLLTATFMRPVRPVARGINVNIIP